MFGSDGNVLWISGKTNAEISVGVGGTFFLGNGSKGRENIAKIANAVNPFGNITQEDIKNLVNEVPF